MFLHNFSSVMYDLLYNKPQKLMLLGKKFVKWILQRMNFNNH